MRTPRIDSLNRRMTFTHIMDRRVDMSSVEEHQSKMPFKRSDPQGWGRRSETVAKWLANCRIILRQWGLECAYYGFSFLENHTVGEILEMVAKTVDVSIEEIYAIGEHEKWIEPGSRNFEPIREQKTSDDYPEESKHPNVRRPEFKPMKVTQVAATKAKDSKPPQDPTHVGYLSDEDLFPEEAIAIPCLNATLKDLWEREVAFRRELEFALSLNHDFRIMHEVTLQGTISAMRKSCYKGINDLFIPEAMMSEPNPCGASETWDRFLTRVYTWMLQRWHPCLQFQRTFVSTVMFDRLVILATANHPQLLDIIVRETTTVDAFSFSHMNDLFDHFRVKYGQTMDSRCRRELRRQHENKYGGSYNATSQGYNGTHGRNGSNGRKRRRTRQKGNPAKRF